MHRFSNYIAIRREYFVTHLLFEDKTEETFEERIKQFAKLNRRFREALDLLTERERTLLLEYINNPHLDNPLFIALFPREKNQRYARVIVNRAAYIVEEYLKRFGFIVEIPRLSLTIFADDEEEIDCEEECEEQIIIEEDPLMPYRAKARNLNIPPELLYHYDNLTEQTPAASRLSEKELYKRVKKLCFKYDIPEELEFCLLTSVAEYLREGTVKPILLVGKPGIGKTYFGKVFAEIIGLYYYKISAPGSSGGRGLTGDSPTFKAARFGEIVNAQLEANATNPVILVDEVDKCMMAASHHTLNDELLSCLDRTRVIHDHFLELDVSTSQIPFILTANEIRRVPAWLKDRCITVEFPDPSEARITSIVMKEFNILKKNALYCNRISMDKDAFMNAVTKMRGRDIVSLRQYENVMDNAAKVAYIEMLEKNRKTMTISDRHFTKVMQLLGTHTTEHRIGFRTE